MKPKSPKDGMDALENREIAVVVTSVAAAVAAMNKSKGPKAPGNTNVSRKLPNSDRRKGTVKGPRGLQAPGRREVRGAILHHESGRQGCRDISLRGVAADRREAGQALEFQPGEKEFFAAHELLRPSGRDGCAGTVVDAAVAAGVSRSEGRSRGDGVFELPRSPEHGGHQGRGPGALHGRG